MPLADDDSADLIQRARVFATRAHGRIDHRRRYSNQPYEVHLKAVAALVAEYTGDPEMIAAAWLHDTVEDTPVTLEELGREFGPGVAELVDQLTDVSRAGDGNRRVRKAIDREHLAGASARAQTVKLADLIDNAVDICRNDTKFARVYLEEMAELLGVLRRGDPRLLGRAERTLAKLTKRLESTDTGAKPPVPQAHGMPQRRLFEIFARVFKAEDIAEPLAELEGDRPLLTAPEVVEGGVFAVREEGFVLGSDFLEGDWNGQVRPFAPSQVLDGDCSLTDVVQVLTRHDHCFTRSEGRIRGVIGRAQMQSPPGAHVALRDHHQLRIGPDPPDPGLDALPVLAGGPESGSAGKGRVAAAAAAGPGSGGESAALPPARGQAGDHMRGPRSPGAPRLRFQGEGPAGGPGAGIPAEQPRPRPGHRLQ